MRKTTFIVVDSGATKADWCLLTSDGFRLKAKTAGINAAVMAPSVIAGIVAQAASQFHQQLTQSQLLSQSQSLSQPPSLAEIGKLKVECIWFYGAGVVSDSAKEAIRIALEDSFVAETFEVETDMMGAARALFGDEPGVVAIMGTGSNSCLYDGKSIVSNIRPGGFILGDEGSGASLGRMFISDYIKELVPQRLADEFHRRTGLEYGSIVENVYRGEAPSRFLAHFAKFVKEFESDDYMNTIIEANFNDFIVRCLERYGVSEVGVVGSFGAAFAQKLAQLGARRGIIFKKFLPSPLDSLVDYHCDHLQFVNI